MTRPPLPSLWLSARAGVARRLESERRPSVTARLLASAWSFVSARRVARPLVLVPGVRTIGVGGAFLGGCCKTPFAIALARAIAARGIDVALVGHGYGARPGAARVVAADDDVAVVGDDALLAARHLTGSKIDVIVAPSRQEAASLASERASCLVFDGLLQARPARLARSILLLDGARPLQNAHCPPAGDLRAPPPALLRAADLSLAVHDEPVGSDVHAHLERAIHPDGRAVLLAELRGAAMGVVLAIARSHRVLEALARRGLHPVATWAFPDHHRPTSAELLTMTARTTQRIDVWLTTGKCATKLPASLAGAPVLVLDHAVRLSDRLVTWIVSGDLAPAADFRAAPVDALFPSAGAVG